MDGNYQKHNNNITEINVKMCFDLELNKTNRMNIEISSKNDK